MRGSRQALRCTLAGGGAAAAEHAGGADSSDHGDAEGCGRNPAAAAMRGTAQLGAGGPAAGAVQDIAGMRSSGGMP